MVGPGGVDGELVAAMAGLGQSLTGRQAEPVVLSPRPDRTVVRYGTVVLKAHAPDTDPTALDARLRVAAAPRPAGVWLRPLRLVGGGPGSDGPGGGGPGGGGSGGGAFVARVRGRLVTAWPAGRAVGPDDADRVPWEAAAVGLARLHAEPLAPAVDVPAAAVGRRLHRVVDRLARLPRDSAGDRDAVLTAYQELPDWAGGPGWAPGRRPAPESGTGTGARPGTVDRRRLIHGDWHLGQLVQVGEGRAGGEADGAGWRFVDVDDLGTGDPVWDLARPAAWFAAGLVGLGEWTRFVDAYRDAGGSALPGDGDPWECVDVPARAVTVQYAATALVDQAAHVSEPDDAAVAVLECCRRMTPSRHRFADLLGTLPTSSDVHARRRP